MKGNAGEHIRWCLERDQIKLTEPQEGIANSYLKKSREALEAASLLEENGFYLRRLRRLLLKTSVFRLGSRCFQIPQFRRNLGRR